MQNTTADYKLEINKPSRSFECKITIGDNIYKNEDLVNLTLEYTQPQEGFAIGNTISQSLDLTLLNRGDIIYSTSQIKVEIGLKIGSTIEYILMGIFNIDDIEKTDYTTKFTAFDNMIKFETAYFSSLGDKPTLQQVVNELSRKTGVEFTGSLPAYTVNKLDGFSCREVLSYVASICGGNAFITRDGKFTIKSLSEVEKAIDGSNYFNYKREEVKYKIGQISCQVDENNILSKGSLGADSMELGFENQWVTETILTEIYNKLNGLSYLGYSMKWQGDISLDPYDIITVTDVKNVVRKIPILSQKISYTGGLTSEIGAKGESKNKNSFSSSGSTTNKVDRIVTELAIVNKALVDVAYIKDLTAGNIKFDTASGNIIDLQTLLTKFVTGENGQFLNLTTDNVTISNAVIKDTIAKNISVEDLKASTISTNKFSIASADGGLSIVGPTMQFKDKNNKVRIQMGQDTKGNFNFILRGEDGTTTLIDHTGIKEKAIADDLIKENMVAADAIGEKQINYSSLITGLNKDTNTSLIQASKVAIDLTGQSLEVAFNSLKTNVDGINSNVKSNTTAINVAQGKIEGIIKESSIVKNDITTLKDNYTSIKTTVDGINTTVASNTSSIEDLTTDLSGVSGKVTAVENKYSTLEQNLNGFKTTVSNDYLNKNDATTIYASKTLLEQTAKDFTFKFSQIGGYNIFKDGQFKNGLNSLYNYEYDFNGSNKSRGYITPNGSEWCLNGRNCLQLRASNSTTGQYGVGQTLKLKKKCTYNFNGFSASHRCNYFVFIQKQATGETYVLAEGTAIGGRLEENWNNWSANYTTDDSDSEYSLFLALRSCGNDGYAWFTDIMVSEGGLKNKFTPNPDEVYNSMTTIDATGLTVHNGALTIKNKLGTTVFNSDTNGNLIFTGTAKSQSGDQFVSMDSGGISFQDWHKKEQMLRIGSSFFTSNRDINGITFAMPLYADFIRFANIAKEDLTNGWSSNDKQYNFFDCWSSDQTVNGIKYKKGMNIYSPVHINNGIKFINDSNYTSDILGNFTWNTITDMLGICGDNGLFLGYRNGSEYNARLVLTEGSHPGTDDKIKSWGHWNCSGYVVHNATFRGAFQNSYANTLTRTFSETHCIEAEDKQVRINFKDIQLKNGKVVLNIPKRYMYINTGYIIASIVKKGKGDVWVAEELENRFIIEGTEDIKINIEVIINIEESSLYTLKSMDDQLCIDMSTGQPIGA